MFSKLLRVLLIVICFSITFELSLQIGLGLGNPPLSIADTKIEYMFAPSQQKMRFGNKITYNSYSMRNIRNPNYNDKIILVLGDSVVNGGSLLDDSELATAKLEKQLNSSQAQYNYFVGNVSSGSWGPQNILEYVKKFGLFNAELVIYVISSHDLYDIPEFLPLDRYVLPKEPYFLATEEFFKKYFFRYIKIFATKFKGEKVNKQIVDRKNTYDKLNELFDFINGYSKPFCVIIHPDLEETINKGSIDYNTLSEYIGSKDVKLKIDMIGKYLPLHYRDDIHLNNIGQSVLAKEFLNCLQ